MAAEESKELKELQELIEFLKANGVAEFDMERPDLKVRLSFAGAKPIVVSAPVMHSAETVQSLVAPAHLVGAPTTAMPAQPGQAAAAPTAEAAEPEAGAHIVKSPIVGTFYEAPSPDADPFVKLGDRVSTGQVLCIIEAMKLMNEIEADASGEIVKVFVKSGQPVEYGQPLFAIK